MADSDADPHKVIRQQFERSAELAAVADDPYASLLPVPTEVRSMARGYAQAKRETTDG